MTEQNTAELFNPEYYDFNFRPVSYFNLEDPIKELLANIKGEARRNWLKQNIQAGMSPADFLLRENLGNGEREFLGKINPTFMGGEYLPDRKECEVEIARFVMDSTTRDVISIRARDCVTSITYFVVDEYRTDFVCQPNSSAEPFTFGEFVHFLNNIYWETHDLRGITAICRANFDIDDCLDFEDLELWGNFISADSEFYPQLRDYFDEEENIWFQDCVGKLNESNDEGGICLQ